MKKVISLILCVLALSLALVACGGDSEIPDGMKRAKENSKIFTLYVPENWVEIETNSDVALVQAQTQGMLDSARLQPESVNAMAWPISESILKDATLNSEQKIEKAYQSYISDYKSQLGGAFTEVSEFTEGVSAREDGRAYIFTAKHNKIYYKYYMNVIVSGSYYYTLTFNFPQKNLEEDKENGGFKETVGVDKATFADSDYAEIMNEIVKYFKTSA